MAKTSSPKTPPPPWTPEGKSAAELLYHAVSGGTVMTPKQLKHYRELQPRLAEALKDAGCTAGDHPELRIAMFLAQAGEETDGLQTMREYASGSEYEPRTDLGNIYPGDGERFAGRGALQTTGRTAYTRFSKWAHEHYPNLVPSDTFFAPPPPARPKGMTKGQWLAKPLPEGFDENPKKLEEPQFAWLVAVWEWTVEGHYHIYRQRVWHLTDRKGRKKRVPPDTPGAVLETNAEAAARARGNNPDSVKVNFNALADAGDIAGATVGINGNGGYPKDKRGIELPIPADPERQYSLPAKKAHFDKRLAIYNRALAMGKEALLHIADPKAAASDAPPAEQAQEGARDEGAPPAHRLPVRAHRGEADRRLPRAERRLRR